MLKGGPKAPFIGIIKIGPIDGDDKSATRQTSRSSIPYWFQSWAEASIMASTILVPKSIDSACIESEAASKHRF
jgi:hypothetical protein